MQINQKKFYVDKLDIDKLRNVLNNLSDLKSTEDKLDLDKLLYLFLLIQVD